MSGDKNVAIVVRVMEKATAPPAKNTMTLLAMAPGAQPTIIMPRDRAGGKLASQAAVAHSNGMTLN